jgi:hypothetical protein
MKAKRMVQQAGTVNERKSDNREQLAQHLAQQPESKRAFDKLMKVLEVAGLALVASYLALAFYISFNWVGVPEKIVAVWFAFPITVAPLMVLVGVHAAGLRAFFPIVLPGNSQEFVTGSKAVNMGAGLAVTSLLVCAFWGTFAWATWTVNWAILEPMIHITGVVVGVGAVIAIVSDLYKKLVRAR